LLSKNAHLLLTVSLFGNDFTRANHLSLLINYSGPGRAVLLACSRLPGNSCLR